MSHPVLERFRKRIRRYGFRAMTPAGVLKAWNGLGPATRKQLLANQWSPGYDPRYTREGYIENQQQRKQYAEAKRAKHDKVFRRIFLKRLRRKEIAAQRPRSRTLRGIAQFFETFEQRKRVLDDCRRQRCYVFPCNSKFRAVPACPLPDDVGHLVPIESYRTVAKVKSWHGQVCRARIAVVRAPSHQNYQAGKTQWSWRGARTSRVANDIRVRSFAVVKDASTAEFLFHNTEVSVTLPAGYSWDTRDTSVTEGLRAYSDAVHADDYHPTAEDLLDPNAAAVIVAGIIQNKHLRQEAKAQNRAQLAQLRGVYVCVCDSLAAGNCMGGTLNFAERYSLDPTKHYSALELHSIVGAHDRRFLTAIAAASRRHEKEMREGLCHLTNHYSTRLAT